MSEIPDETDRSQVEGVDYSPEGIEGARLELIMLRDGALARGEFHEAVLLSHAIAYLWDYRALVLLDHRES